MAEEPIQRTEQEVSLEWVRTIFGTEEAYLASLPRNIWVKGANGWVGASR